MASSVVYRRKLGLIMGINQYTRDNDRLQYCINDATDLNTALQHMGFETFLGLDYTYDELKTRIDRFVERIEHDDLVLFYFAGHGKQNEDENYLLPSDYDYDHLRDEHDYIVNHAINVKYIMKKIDDRKCRITIYLFDCCRLKTKRRIRAMNASLGLGPIIPKLQTLIVFACAPGEATLDETWNNRNGSFIENLLKHVTTLDEDIEDILKKVARDVNRQTGGVQQPYRTSSLTGEVYLVTRDSEGQSIFPSSQINLKRKWTQGGLTIAGGDEQGNQLNQLDSPEGIFVDDDDQCIYIAEWHNHRIVQWKFGAKIGQILAGGDTRGDRMDQLNYPTNVIVDKKTDSLIICDRGNRRVVRWPRRNGTCGQTIISDINCFSLTMDDNGDLYVSDSDKNEVRRWKTGVTEGTIVAGGNGQGDQLHQLNWPTHLFVDKDQSIYVSDCNNHRVMKWMKGAREGIVVAGGQGEGARLTQLHLPAGLAVDRLDNVYVADSSNHRIVCWAKGSTEGRLIVDGNGEGVQPNQFKMPKGLSFDRQGSLYVADRWNHRIQKFEIDLW